MTEFKKVPRDVTNKAFDSNSIDPFINWLDKISKPYDVQTLDITITLFRPHDGKVHIIAISQ